MFIYDIGNIPGFFLFLKYDFFLFIARSKDIRSISILMFPCLNNFCFNMIDVFHKEYNIFGSIRTLCLRFIKMVAKLKLVICQCNE